MWLHHTFQRNGDLDTLVIKNPQKRSLVPQNNDSAFRPLDLDLLTISYSEVTDIGLRYISRQRACTKPWYKRLRARWGHITGKARREAHGVMA